MVAPPRPVAPAGLGAVGTSRNGRGVGTMETMMTKKIGQPKQSGNARAAKAKTGAPRGRQRPQTKKQIAVSLLKRSKGASIAEMQRAMGWQIFLVIMVSMVPTPRPLRGVPTAPSPAGATGRSGATMEPVRPVVGRQYRSPGHGSPVKSGPKIRK